MEPSDAVRDAGVEIAFEPGAGRVSDQVLDAIGAYTDTDPIDLPPLYSAVDPDALDALFEPTDPDVARSLMVRFEYDTMTVTLTNSGTITIDPSA